MILKQTFEATLIIVATTCFAMNLKAEIRLPAQISSKMVLQQNTKANIWGWDSPGTKITITTSWNDDKYSVSTSKDGSWLVPISTPEGSFEAKKITISNGKETVVLDDVLIGEVWLASGQSNMEMPLFGFSNCPVIGSAQDIVESSQYKGKIRYVTLPKEEAYSPMESADGEWKECEPKNAPLFGAVGYYFAQNLTNSLNVPVGIINNAWGGSRVEGWLPKEVIATYDEPTEENACKAQYPMAMSRPMVMYNGQFYPIRNYTFRGAIWYQGESNAGILPNPYKERMQKMIEVFRHDLGNAELPFYMVQLAPYWNNDKDAFDYPIVREQQKQIADEDKNVHLISIMDLVKADEMTQIHPGNKKEVGRRLSYLALANEYGIEGVPCVVPEFERVILKSGKIEIRFKNISAAGGFGRLADFKGLEICGSDQIWFPADVFIHPYMNTFEVSSPDVPEPVAVRYGFRNFIECNLTAANGLALFPFRSDRILEGEGPAATMKTSNVDFTGTWEGMVESSFGQNKVNISINKCKDGNWTGTYNGSTIKDVSTIGSTIDFSFSEMGFEIPGSLTIINEKEASMSSLGIDSVLSKIK